ncbi:MAG: OmpA family protein [Thermodesulfobacteriota bacterium]
MKNYLTRVLASIVLLSAFAFVSNASAFEIITEDDIRQGVIVNLDLIKTADNAILLFDSSSSMSKPFRNTGKSKYEIAKKILMERNEYFPDLGHNMGLYLHTPWKEVYPMQKYNREKYAQALATLPEKASGPTFLKEGLERLDGILKNVSGKTAVFVFTDGTYSGTTGGGMKKPSEIAESLAKKYDVCFYLVSTVDDYYSIDLFNKVVDYNFCSRVIPLDDFVNRSGYNSEALYTVKATKDIITITDKKVVGIKTNSFLFDFNKADLSQDEMERLSLLASYLNDNKKAYTAIAGYTDSIGTEEYNLALSYRRVEAIAKHLVEKHNVDQSQLQKFWYGEANPVANNSTEEGRRQNRRVEIKVGGM